MVSVVERNVGLKIGFQVVVKDLTIPSDHSLITSCDDVEKCWPKLVAEAGIIERDAVSGRLRDRVPVTVETVFKRGPLFACATRCLSVSEEVDMLARCLEGWW